MTAPKELFELNSIPDNPLFWGFAFKGTPPSVLGRSTLIDDLHPGYSDAKTNRNWKVVRLKKLWKAPAVEGNVTPFNDCPGAFDSLAFSRRACDALRDLLEPNGELLPLNSQTGEYYLFNITTVVDALDADRSECNYWSDVPNAVQGIDYFAFHEETLRGLSIFRIVDAPSMPIVTDGFVDRVHQAGLNGFQFNKIWPFRRGLDWRLEAAKQHRKVEKKAKSKEKRKETVVIFLTLEGDKANKVEKKKLKASEAELEAQLMIPTLKSPYFGWYESYDTIDGDFRMFLTCPSADALVTKLLPWLQTLDWHGDIHVMKRYGDMYDESATEELVEF